MTTQPRVVVAYFDAWKARDASLLREVLDPQVSVTGPLGQLDGAEAYRNALARIFAITKEITIVKQWVDGPDTLTWFDLHHTHGSTSTPVANWVHVGNDLITRVRITFDARAILN